MTTADDVVWRSGSMRAVCDDATAAARCDVPLLLTGEPGVGKQFVARLVHGLSDRRLARFVDLNCAGASDTVLEGELFGDDGHDGTDRGTVLLREVGEMSARIQEKLMRVLEHATLQRVGVRRSTGRCGVRVISGTTQPLMSRIAAGTFREDLYYRLNLTFIQIPPLRERVEDVEPLLLHFLLAFAEDMSLPVPLLRPGAIEPLLQYEWPGNVKELRNVARRLVEQRHALVTAEDMEQVIADALGAAGTLGVRSASSDAPAVPIKTPCDAA